jgi:CheY-like chemotaxis protein
MTAVLLVEDDPAARQGLELALRRLGYDVRSAADAQQAE